MSHRAYNRGFRKIHIHFDLPYVCIQNVLVLFILITLNQLSSQDSPIYLHREEICPQFTCPNLKFCTYAIAPAKNKNKKKKTKLLTCQESLHQLITLEPKMIFFHILFLFYLSIYLAWNFLSSVIPQSSQWEMGWTECKMNVCKKRSWLKVGMQFLFELSKQYTKGESKVLQYFTNMRENSTALDAFTEVMNHARMWDAKLKCY